MGVILLQLFFFSTAEDVPLGRLSHSAICTNPKHPALKCDALAYSVSSPYQAKARSALLARLGTVYGRRISSLP